MTSIVKAYPPNIDAIRARFPHLHPGTVFAYGDTIYSPASDKLPANLIVHERVHFAQQAAIGGPEAWWNRYLADPAFRLEQEVEAYRAQYASVVELPRPERRALLAHICKLLAGGMYGPLVTKEQARRLVAGSAA